MILLPIVALLIGAAIALGLRVSLDGVGGQYLAVACLAGLDTVLGGIRAGLDNKFQNDVFVTGFVGNVLIAFFLAWLGDQIYINLLLAVALVLGTRIFANLSFIRRQLLGRWEDARRRRMVQAETVAISEAAVASPGIPSEA